MENRNLKRKRENDEFEVIERAFTRMMDNIQQQMLNCNLQRLNLTLDKTETDKEHKKNEKMWTNDQVVHLLTVIKDRLNDDLQILIDTFNSKDNDNCNYIS